MAQRIAGIIQLQVDGEVQDASGNFSYNLGEPRREAMLNAAGQVVGYKEIPQTPFIEGEIIDRGTLDQRAFVKGTNKTINLTLGSGNMFVLSGAFFAGEGTGGTEDAKLPVRWEGESADIVKVNG